MEIDCAWCGHTLVMESFEVKHADNNRTYIRHYYKCYHENCPCENKTYVCISQTLTGNNNDTEFELKKL